MIPMASLEVAHARAAELQRSAARSRGARQVALEARKRELLARRTLRAELPDRPIVTARPVRPRAAAPQPSPATLPAPAPAPVLDRQPVGVAARADADELTPCTAC
jgi:hypothetical protein